MDPEVRRLVMELFEARLRAFESILDLDLSTFDRCLVEMDGRPPVAERLARLAWHDDAHTEELGHIKYALGKPCSMDLDSDYPVWFFRQALLSRARLMGELLNLTAEDLSKRAKPGDRTIAELLKHLLATEHGFLVDGIKAAVKKRSEADRVGRRTRVDFVQGRLAKEADL